MDTPDAAPTGLNHDPSSDGRRVAVPERTLLLSPKPVGMGTAQAESPSSYFTRVARLNGLTPLQLIHGTKAAPVTLTSPALSKLRTAGLTCFHRRAVATSDAGRKFIDVLAAIVGRPELPRLHWGTSFSGFSLARMTRDCDAWCPECLRSDAEPYGRLAWENPLVTHCSIHKCRLETSCPSCRRTVRWAGATNIAHCRHCGYDRRESKPSFVDDPAETELAVKLGHLVDRTTSPDDNFHCTAPQCVSALREFARRSGHVGLHPEAAFLGLDPVTLWNWENAKGAPSVGRIVEIAFALGQSPVDVLLGVRPGTAPQGRPAKPLELAPLWRCERLSPGKRADLIRRLTELAQAFPTMGPLRAAKKLGVEPVTLNQIAPALCAKMVASRKCTLARLRKARFAWFAARVDRYVAETVKLGCRPTWPGVMALFRENARIIFLNPAYARYVREAFRGSGKSPLEEKTTA